jgi:hypothetical protein
LATRQEAMSKQETIIYVGRKITLCNQIYKFMMSLCRSNHEN